ncbi:OLC1v1023190C1 [Oldenlandia corymbosa var. corymbosa]|uniref:OLC1v1023190C1 n=1 Tax=Oldenlandia corymbosa var. corymbosa TaxID=529605 RepID=A0AAV1C1W2_OLDCO|nr:OLC1v1023190C1 [Oldenlandia corymbosa var. corymbosa]
MDSESVGAIDNGDLSARERVRWGDKVYTRRNFRKKAKLGISNSDSATTTYSAVDEPYAAPLPPADTKVSSSSPAKDDLAASGTASRPSVEGILDEKDGHFSNGEAQPVPSRSEVGPSTPDGVRQPEDDSRGGDAVSSGGEGPPSLSVRVDGGVLGDGQDSALNGEREPPLRLDSEALPQPLSNGGQHAVPNGGEKPPSLSRDGQQSSSELQHTGEPESLPGITQSQSQIVLVDAQTTTSEQVEAATAAQINKELQGTVPISERSHARIDGPVNGVVTAGLANGLSKPMVAKFDDRVRIDINGSRPRDEMRNLKRKLEHELEQVKSLVDKLRTKELQLTAYTSEVNTNTRYVSGIGDYSQPLLARSMSEVGVVGHPYGRPQLNRVNSEVRPVGYQDPRPFGHLSVSLMENNHGISEFVEKEKQEKRTPKANQFYRNSEFLLGKDRLPPETNKRLKLNYGGKRRDGNAEYGYGYGYQNRDKVFKSCRNLLQKLMKHKHGWTYYNAGLPVITPRKAVPPVFNPVPAPVLTPPSVPPSFRGFDRSDSMPIKPSNSNPPRTTAPKKPKAKDPNKRDMTYEEKQKLSSNLQSLPPEKLDAIVQIIKKRSTALSQHDDEIEVDIDNVDAETLWELDRFVTNYKKSLSKNKRKAELALKRRAEAAQAAQTNPAPAVVEAQTEHRTDDQINPLVEVGKQGDNVSGSSSSSSSSSDSGSSSSDSDSDSSSGSDGGHSPKS